MLEINDLSVECLKITLERRANGSRIEADPLKAAAGEILEATQSRSNYYFFKSLRVNDTLYNQADAEQRKSEYGEELADAAICLMTAAALDHINLEAAIKEKILKNRDRALMIGDKF